MILTIRDAKPLDAEGLLQIYAWYVENTAVSFEYQPPTLDEFRERMAVTMVKYPWLVAEGDGRLLGYACAGPFKARDAYDWSCETTIYLDRERRGHGIGRALYEALETALAGMGIRNLYACIAWADPEDATLTLDSPRFHQHMGYTLVGRFRQCANKFGRWYDMVWMEKTIGKHEPGPEAVHIYPKEQ